ncbi:hypothetical protein [Mucilaginibacter pineti]|nr:hypothetical protein [Mucilaginibacter pineti]
MKEAEILNHAISNFKLITGVKNYSIRRPQDSASLEARIKITLAK